MPTAPPRSPAASPPRRASTSARSRAPAPGGKITKADVLAAADGNGRRPAAAPAAGEAKPLRGPAAMLAKAMDESRAIPTATSFRTLPVDTLDAKRKALNGALKERGMKVSFTHLIAWAIVKAAIEWPVMGRSFEDRDGKPYVIENPAGQPRDRGRRRAQGRAQPDGPVHQGRRRDGLRRLPRLLRGADHQDAGEQAHRRRLPGHEHLAHQPGRARHGRLGAAADEGPGDDRRRPARSPTRSSGRTRRPRRSSRSGSRR